MKTKIALSTLLLSSQIFFSQTKTIENIRSFDFINFGSIVKDSISLHYSFYTTTKTLENKQVEGVLTFYDKNLFETKKETFILSNKNNIFLEAKNNGNQIILGFHDQEKELTTFKIFSSKGELVNTKEINLKKNVFSPFYYKSAETIGDFSLTFPIKNKGFLISEIIKKKRIGYNIHFIGNNESENWVYQSPQDHDNRKSACPMFANDEVLVIMEKEWGSVYDKQPTFIAIIIDINTGKELFRVSHKYETTPNFYTKAIVNSNEEIVLFGETYNLENNYPDNDYNTGYFIEKYSKSGQLIVKNSLSFKDLAFKTSLGFNIEDKQKEFGTIHFYDIMVANGKYFAIGEIARRDKQGFTIAKALTSYAIGGAAGGLISNNWDTKYTIENLVIVELDENLKLTTTHKLEKEKNYTGLNTIIVRPYFNLKEMEVNGKLDYLFNLKDNDNFQSVFYLDRKIENFKPDFRIKKAVKENDVFKTFEFSKIELNDNESNFRISPINVNSLLLMKYEANKNTVKLDILK